MVPPSLEYYSFLLAANSCLHDTTGDDAMDTNFVVSFLIIIIVFNNSDMCDQAKLLQFKQKYVFNQANQN